MADNSETCWTLIQGAADGSPADREQFARRYGAIIRAYLLARWQHVRGEIDDAIQEVFLECFRGGGALERAEQRRKGGFRAFLFGVTRNVAARFEGRRHGGRERSMPSTLGSAAADEDLEAVFRRAWARSIMKQAAERQAQLSRARGADAQRRVELLKRRFQDGAKIRDLAAEWDCDADVLHHEYAKARREFERALREVVAFHLPGAPDEVDEECAGLLALLR